MSSRLSPDEREQLQSLIQALQEERITPEESARLEQWICHDEEARWFYVQYMNLVALLYWDRSEESEPVQPVSKESKEGKRAGESPVLGLLGDAFQAGVSFLSRSFVLTLLLAIGLPGILFLLLVIDMARQPVARPPVAVAPLTVAQVTRTHDCVWQPGSEALSDGALLLPGRQVRLSRGIVEIIFDSGARVLVQGPATFDAASAKQGFLRAGSLVAHVGAEARGFAVATPTATIVDLGTEFGVCVNEEGRAADVQVFQGEVELAPAAAKNHDVARHRLAAGRAVRVAMSDRDSAVVVTEIAPQKKRFVRELPAPVQSTQTAIVADFSGGAGDSQPDQFPGAAGSGWAGGWSVRETKKLNSTASIEEQNPLRGNGKYLRASIERQPGNSKAGLCAGVERRLTLDGPVDLTKPYVLSFDFRVDALRRFTSPGDRVSICSRRRSQAESQEGSGWHICVVGGESARFGHSGNWSFLQCDEASKRRNVDSGIPVREGSVYSFRILVDPPARQWTPSIAVDGGQPTAFAPMGMRSEGTAKDNGYWPFVHLFGRVRGGNEGANVEKISFSVDSIRITAASAPQGGPIPAGP